MFVIKKSHLLAVLMLLNSIFMAEAVPAPAAVNNESKDYQHICADHPPVSNTKISNSSKWNWEGINTKERHFHIGNEVARQKIASVVHGRDVDDAKEDYSKLCAAFIGEYKEGHAESILYGFGNEKADMKGIVHPEIKGALLMSFVNKASKYCN